MYFEAKVGMLLTERSFTMSGARSELAEGKIVVTALQNVG